MNITEIFEYAKEKDEKLVFEFVNLKGETVQCQVLDAWFGFFKIGNNEGFVTIEQWKTLTGDSFDLKIKP